MHGAEIEQADVSRECGNPLDQPVVQRERRADRDERRGVPTHDWISTREADEQDRGERVHADPLIPAELARNEVRNLRVVEAAGRRHARDDQRERARLWPEPRHDPRSARRIPQWILMPPRRTERRQPGDAQDDEQRVGRDRQHEEELVGGVHVVHRAAPPARVVTNAIVAAREGALPIADPTRARHAARVAVTYASATPTTSEKRPFRSRIALQTNAPRKSAVATDMMPKLGGTSGTR